MNFTATEARKIVLGDVINMGDGAGRLSTETVISIRTTRHGEIEIGTDSDGMCPTLLRRPGSMLQVLDR